MPRRKYEAQSGYRYGFNGKEKEFSNNSTDFGIRILDNRIGRWFVTDAIVKSWLSSYNYSGNNPINNIDPDGKDEIHFHFSSTVHINSQGLKTGPSHAWVVIIKTNGPDKFYHHSHITEVKLPTNYSKGGVSTFEKSTEFYPWNPDKRSGLTTEPVPFLSWILPDRKDRDYVTLLKYVNTFPEVEKYIQGRGKHDAPTFDTEMWEGVPGDRKLYSAISTVTRVSENLANVLMIVDGVGGLTVKPQSNPFQGLEFAKQNAKAEELTGKALNILYPESKGFKVIPKPKLKYDDISGSFFPDWVVINTNQKTVVGVFDSKGATGTLTSQQRPFFRAGSSATIEGGAYNGLQVNPAGVTKQTYNWNRATGAATTTVY